MLARLRRGRRLSQLALAARAGLSQRHISFIETGRAQPGPAAIRKLIEGLGLSRAEASALLGTINLAGQATPVDWLSDAFAQARSVAALLLDNHDPYPALICARDGTVLQANRGFDALIALADPDGLLAVLAQNLYDLTLHPDGLPRLMVNPEAIVAHTIHRLRRAAEADDAAAKALRRAIHYPAVRDATFATARAPAAAVLTEHYRVRGETLSIVTMSAAFGCPEDELAQQVSVELFFPADVRAASIMRGG
jgi:transcriptional regulator with XRE-family HTH domain